MKKKAKITLVLGALVLALGLVSTYSVPPVTPPYGLINLK